MMQFDSQFTKEELEALLAEVTCVMEIETVVECPLHAANENFESPEPPQPDWAA
jgi:hypothetical protein